MDTDFQNWRGERPREPDLNRKTHERKPISHNPSQTRKGFPLSTLGSSDSGYGG
jgi:hypothetical protein